MTNNLTCDASTLRDMSKLKLLSPLTKLGYNLHTTSLACKGLDDATRFEVEGLTASGLITVNKFMERDYTAFLKMRQDYPGISRTDCSVIFMAWQYNYLLITSDPYVIDIARKVNVTTLKYSNLLGEMYEANLLTIAEATEKYLELTTVINTRCDLGNQIIPMPEVAYSLINKQSAG
ncbi:MAG: hypothetical protein FD170_3743 [Bacteroidetes bacterium]|nr:MAG: hypothetical protein FD170_3743 [Bacteroidota bacterium]